MKPITSLYLAGPDVFFPEPQALFARKRAACEKAGFKAITPLDAKPHETEISEAMAREIYASNLAALRSADAVVVNLSPWRGPGADAGSAFEAGVAAALGKPVFAYMNVDAEDDAEYFRRVENTLGANLSEDKLWRDDMGAEIENFGLPENLMLWAEARCFVILVTPEPFLDLTALELTLDEIKRYGA